MMLATLAALGPDEIKTLGIVAVMVTAFASAVLYPVARAYARRLETGASAAGLKGELADIAARLDEIERGQARMAELEERLDFAERLLARQPDPGRLPGA